MKNRTQILNWIAFALCLLTGIVLSLKSLREPDIWWMLRTGEWIWENKSFISHDVFSFTRDGTNWINVKWGFELLLYFVNTIGGPEFTLIIQAFVTIAILWMLTLTYRQLKSNIWKTDHRSIDPFIVSALFALLFTVEFRLIGRPEMISHLMTAAYILILFKWKNCNSRLIWLLIPLQIIWTNFHEAFGTGVVILVVFCAGLWFDYFLKMQNRKTLRQLRMFTVLVFAAILSICINPYGPKMILHPLNIFLQLGENKFTSELLSIRNPAYWKLESYLNLLFALFSVGALLLLPAINSVKKYLAAILHLGSGYLILLCLFLYLSFSAYRNIPFFIIVSAPLLAVALKLLYQQCRSVLKVPIKFSGISLLIFQVFLIAFGAIYYWSVVTDRYYHFFNKKDRYGLQISNNFHPSGASDFIRDNQIRGRCFSDYLTSSYLLWDLRPDYKSFIDLRDLDVFEASMFDSILLATADPNVFQHFDAKYNFNYAVVYRQKFGNLHFYLTKGSAYELVYFDPVAAIYLKNNASNQAIIKQYGYRQFPDQVGHAIEPIPPSAIAALTTKLFNPFFTPEPERAQQILSLAATSFYRSIKNYGLAEQHAEYLQSSSQYKYEGTLELGNIYLEMAQTKGGFPEEQKKFLQLAGSQFSKASQLDKKSANAALGQGIVLLQMGLDKRAADKIIEAADLGKAQSEITAQAAQCFEALYQFHPNKTEYLNSWIKYLNRLIKFEPRNPSLKSKLAYAYCQNNNCKLAKKWRDRSVAVQQSGFSNLSSINAQVENCLKSCSD